MVANFFNLLFLVASGFFIGYTDSSPFWAIIPIMLGTYLGCWNSHFAKALSSKNVSPVLREKLLSTIKTLSLFWVVIAICFTFTGYGLTFLVKQ